MTERDTEICTLYASGLTLKALSERFHVSTQRIRQVLRRAPCEVCQQPVETHGGDHAFVSVFKKYRDKYRSERGAFIGVEVTAETKGALKQMAEDQGRSVSLMVSDALDEMVK